jgi:preprotein translocase subunit SecA
MFNAMMDGIREESVGNLFNLQFEIQENPIVEEVGAGAQLAFGGALPGVTAGPPASAQTPGVQARSAPVIPPAPPEPVAPPAAFGRRQGGAQPSDGRQSSGRSRGRHAADGRDHATAAGRGQAAARSGGGLHAAPDETAAADESGVAEVTQSRPQPVLPEGLAPRRPRNLQYSAPSEDGGVERHGNAEADPYATVGRNDLCPCGSGRKYKRCHGGRQG